MFNDPVLTLNRGGCHGIHAIFNAHSHIPSILLFLWFQIYLEFDCGIDALLSKNCFVSDMDRKWVKRQLDRSYYALFSQSMHWLRSHWNIRFPDRVNGVAIMGLVLTENNIHTHYRYIQNKADMGFTMGWYPVKTWITHIMGIWKTCRNRVHHEKVSRENMKSTHYR